MTSPTQNNFPNCHFANYLAELFPPPHGWSSIPEGWITASMVSMRTSFNGRENMHYSWQNVLQKPSQNVRFINASCFWICDMRIGYARVSTDDQTLDLQRDALKRAKCRQIYEEHASNIGIAFPDTLLTHVSPIGWEHINLTGDYTWQSNRRVAQGRLRRPVGMPTTVDGAVS